VPERGLEKSRGGFNVSFSTGARGFQDRSGAAVPYRPESSTLLKFGDVLRRISKRLKLGGRPAFWRDPPSQFVAEVDRDMVASQGGSTQVLRQPTG